MTTKKYKCKECAYYYQQTGVGDSFAKKLCCIEPSPISRDGNKPACRHITIKGEVL